jgi:hypothetical protein
MRKPAILKEQQRNRMLETAGINSLQGANLISVDIQPEYEKGFTFKTWEYLNFLNKNIEALNSLTFLYNGTDTVGGVSEDEYKWWLVENGFEEENLNYSRFYDKGYAFFRYCIDEGIDDDDIVALVKYMSKHNINDSRDIDEQMWVDFMKETGADQSDVRDLLEYAGDCVSVPDLMDYLQRYSGRIILTGGGINECLKEVEIALMAMEKPYNVLTQYTY